MTEKDTLTEEETLRIIKSSCKYVRKLVLKWGEGDPAGQCYESSYHLKECLYKHGIKTELVGGVFNVDFDRKGNRVEMASDEDGHFWLDWNGVVIDVTADQFNCQLEKENEVKAIVIGESSDRYLDYNFNMFYNASYTMEDNNE